jgi:hypothetical protein
MPTRVLARRRATWEDGVGVLALAEDCGGRGRRVRRGRSAGGTAERRVVEELRGEAIRTPAAHGARGSVRVAHRRRAATSPSATPSAAAAAARGASIDGRRTPARRRRRPSLPHVCVAEGCCERRDARGGARRREDVGERGARARGFRGGLALAWEDVRRVELLERGTEEKDEEARQRELRDGVVFEPEDAEARQRGERAEGVLRREDVFAQLELAQPRAGADIRERVERVARPARSVRGVCEGRERSGWRCLTEA